MPKSFKSVNLTPYDNIKEFLKKLGVPVYPNENVNRLNVIKMFQAYDQIEQKDVKYLQDFRFDGLYLANDETIEDSMISYDLDIGNRTREEKIKAILGKKLYPVQTFVGGTHTIALTTEGLFSWGRNKYGQLGLGDNFGNNQYNFPRRVTIPGSVLWVSCGGDHTIALTTEGLFAWGLNSYGQLGLGNNNYQYNLPQKVILNNVIRSLLTSPYKQTNKLKRYISLLSQKEEPEGLMRLPTEIIEEILGML